MADNVGEFLPLLVLHFRTIVIVTENHRSNPHPPDPPGQGVPMIPPHPSNQGCRTPISLLLMISHLQVLHNLRHNLLTRTNTFITTHPTNLRSVRETVEHTRGHTILWNEMSPTTMSPPPPINFPYPSHPPGLRDLHPFKRRPFPSVRSGRDFIITRG